MKGRLGLGCRGLERNSSRAGKASFPRMRRSRVAMLISTLRIVTASRSRAEVVRTLAAQLGPTRVQPGWRKCDL